MVAELRSLSISSYPFYLAVGMSRKNIFVDDTYLLDPNNYEINPKDIHLVKISKVDANSVAYGDCVNFNNNDPYYLQLSLNSKPQSVSISLQYKAPQWAYNCSTENDNNKVPASDVTFGISYMMEGITEAFRNMSSNQSIVKITFGIKN